MTAPRWGHGLLAAAAGGGLGTLVRWLLVSALPAAATGGFPWTVLAINVVGATLLAGLGLLAAARSRPWLAVFLGTGVCGGFTTMSTASVDALGLLHDDRLVAAAAYVGGTLLGSLVGARVLMRAAGNRQRDVEAEGGDL